MAAQDRPLPAASLAEVLATSDLPGGVVNLLTGFTAELAPWLAAHRDVNALDLTGAEPGARADLQAAAADNVKRVYVPRDDRLGPPSPAWPGSTRSSRPRRSGTRSACERGR